MERTGASPPWPSRSAATAASGPYGAANEVDRLLGRSARGEHLGDAQRLELLDVIELKALGVSEVFTPGASAQSAIDFIRSAVRD